MKRLIQTLCWSTIALMVVATIGLPTAADVTPWAWVIVVMGLVQSILTLTYIHRHDRQDKNQARIAERAALKAEILAEMA